MRDRDTPLDCVSQLDDVITYSDYYVDIDIDVEYYTNIMKVDSYQPSEDYQDMITRGKVTVKQ